MEFHEGPHRGLDSLRVVEEKDDDCILDVVQTAGLVNTGPSLWIVDVAWAEKEQTEVGMALITRVGCRQSNVMSVESDF
jgi:hypothetical protein